MLTFFGLLKCFVWASGGFGFRCARRAMAVLVADQISLFPRVMLFIETLAGAGPDGNVEHVVRLCGGRSTAFAAGLIVLGAGSDMRSAGEACFVGSGRFVAGVGLLSDARPAAARRFSHSGDVWGRIVVAFLLVIVGLTIRP